MKNLLPFLKGFLLLPALLLVVVGLAKLGVTPVYILSIAGVMSISIGIGLKTLQNHREQAALKESLRPLSVIKRK